nr:endolytic transglycosylase MltG [Alphaproteobacteria bacterium]
MDTPPRVSTPIILIFALIIPILFGGSGFFFGRAIMGKGPLAETTAVIIEPGAGVKGTAAALQASGIIKYEWLFPVAVAMTGNKSKLQAGEYEFAPQISMFNVISKMARGEVLARKITVTEGLTSKQIVSLLNENEFLTGEIMQIPPEGSLMPDTYNFTRNDSREKLIARMESAMLAFTNSEWAKRAPEYPLQTVQEWVTLASIVEAETPKPEERPRVAGVYLNRLAQNMRLEADPTVAYGMNDGAGKLDKPLTFKDLQTPSAFNTYTNDGLPPSPINN